MEVKELKQLYPTYPIIQEEHKDTDDGKIMIISSLLRKEFDGVWYLMLHRKVWLMMGPSNLQLQSKLNYYVMYCHDIYKFLVLGKYSEEVDKDENPIFFKDDDQSSEAERLIKIDEEHGI